MFILPEQTIADVRVRGQDFASRWSRFVFYVFVFVLYLFVRHLLAVSLSRLSRLNSEMMLISLGRKVVQNFVSEALDGAITECLFVSTIREYDFRVEHAYAVM